MEPIPNAFYFAFMDRPICLKQVASKINLFSYKTDNNLPKIFRVCLTEKALEDLTRELYKPRMIPQESAKTLHVVNGMLVRKTESGQFVFVGYLRPPSFYLQTTFTENGLFTKSYAKNEPCPGDDTLAMIDYSVPFGEPDVRPQQETVARRMTAYIENIESFTTRPRGEYFCIFRVPGGSQGRSQLVACSQTELFSLEPNALTGRHTENALLFIYGIAGLNVERLRSKENTSNHTETSYIVICDQGPLNVFHRPGRRLFDICYINSSLQARFFLNAYKPKTFELFAREDVNASDDKKIPYSDPRWMRYFTGYQEFLSKRPKLQAQEKKWVEEGTHAHGNEKLEYGAIEVYDSFFMTNIVFCTEREFLIDMLTSESSDVFSVAKRLTDFFQKGELKVKQYSIKWPQGFADARELAEDLFHNRKLNILLDNNNRQKPTMDLLKAFILAIFRMKENMPETLVHLVKEKVTKPFAAGEHQFTRENGQSGRIHVSGYEMLSIDTKCTTFVSKNVGGNSYLIKFACSVNNNGKKTTLVADLDDFSMQIVASHEKIVNFLFALLKQTMKSGQYDIRSALKSTEFPEKTSPINWIQPSAGLLEKAILAIAFNKFPGENNSFPELEEYAGLIHSQEMALSARSEEFTNSIVQKTGGYLKEEWVISNNAKEAGSMARKAGDFVSAVYSRSHLVISEIPDSGMLSITSQLYDISFVIPRTYELEPEYSEITVVKPMPAFIDCQRKLKPFHEDNLWLLFHECGLDYYAFGQMETPLERSSYLSRLYSKLSSKPSLASFIEEDTPPNRPDCNIDTSYRTDYSFVVWKAFSGF